MMKYARLWVLSTFDASGVGGGASAHVYESEDALIASLRDNYDDLGELSDLPDEELSDALENQGIYASWEAIWLPYDLIEVIEA